MQTLTHGYQKPDNNDTGDVFYTALANDIQKLNDHTHNGTDGALLAITTQSILSASWGAAPIGGGLYVQTVTLPAGFTYDTTSMSFRLSTGEAVYPSVERASANTYKIYTNNNTLTYTAFYR